MGILSFTHSPVPRSQDMGIHNSRGSIPTATGLEHPRSVPHRTDLQVILHLPMGSH